MGPFNNIAQSIIKEQELIIGPLAWVEAKKVAGLNVADEKSGELSIAGDPKETLDKLVAQYERLFGRASHEVCRHAAAKLIANMPTTDVPSSLRLA